MYRVGLELRGRGAADWGGAGERESMRGSGEGMACEDEPAEEIVVLGAHTLTSKISYFLVGMVVLRLMRAVMTPAVSILEQACEPVFLQGKHNKKPTRATGE